jgi:hypothetical protein
MDRDNRKVQFRKINEMDEGAEFSEDDILKASRTMKKINEFIRFFKTLPETYFNTELHRLLGMDHWAKQTSQLDDVFSNRLYCVVPGSFYAAARPWFL